MSTFLPIRHDRRLFKNRSKFNLYRYKWEIRWFVKSWLIPGLASAGFVFMLAYALMQWCMQP